MFQPRTITLTARAALALCALTAGVLMLGPFQGAEGMLLLTDKQAHAMAFFTLAVLSFVAAPRMRRTDLALAVLAIGAASEVAQACVGRDGNLPDLIADSIGVLVAWAPTHAEMLRRRAREPKRPERRVRARAQARPPQGQAAA